jgi:hypothetical protein
MMWLYLDDSGKWAWNPHSTPSLGFGGAIGSVSQWCQLLSEWRAILNPLDAVGIDTFHATEWRDKDLVFLSRLAPSICKRVSPVGAIMPSISLALAQGVALGDASQRLRAYDFAFEDCLSIAAQRAHAVGDALHVILARNDEYKQRAFDLFREFKKRRPEGAALRGFSRDVTAKDLEQLQVADFIAWILNLPSVDPDDPKAYPSWCYEAQGCLLTRGSFSWLHRDALAGRRSLLDPSVASE